MGTCPKCGNFVGIVNAFDVEINPMPSPGHTWRGLKYCCVSCGAVLSVQMDPISLKADTVDQLLAALRKH
jgi:hypothetical protein